MRARPDSLAAALGGIVLAACLVQRPVPDPAPATAAHETRRTYHAGGATRSETRVLVWSDGRIERDGPEREYFPGGTMEAERFFRHDAPTGSWRTWFASGTLRSEVDFGLPGSDAPCVQRFWHANGQLAAEGEAVAGVREGHWQYWSENGSVLRAGSYRGGKRDGLWIFHDENGAKCAEGPYVLGARVGSWTLWDERGEAHERAALEVELDDQ